MSMKMRANVRGLGVSGVNCRSLLVGASICLGLLLAGCSPAPSAPAGKSAAAPSLAELVAQLEKHTGAIQAAFEKKEPAAADEPLHEVGHVLGGIPAAAKAAGVSATAQADIDAALTDLRDAFIVLHDTMHVPAAESSSPGADAHAGHDHPEGEGADHEHPAGSAETADAESPGVKAYSEVSGKIKDSLAKLKQATQAG